MNEHDRINDRIFDKKRNQRLHALVHLIEQGEMSSAAEIAEALSVTPVTIWRDLKVLSGLGFEIKTKGKWMFLDTQNDTQNDTVVEDNGE